MMPCLRPLPAPHAFRRRFYVGFMLLLSLLLMSAKPCSAISGGSDATQLKGQVQVYVNRSNTGNPADETYVCTGTLIDASWVLTAKHCVNNYQGSTTNMAVYMGNFALGQGERHILSGIVLNNDADAALLHLSTPTLQLAVAYGVDIPDLNNRIVASIQAWGPTVQGSNRPARVLQGASFQVDHTVVYPVSVGTRGAYLLTSQGSFLQLGDSGAGVIFDGLVCGVQSKVNLLSTSAWAVPTTGIKDWIKNNTDVGPGGLCRPSRTKKVMIKVMSLGDRISQGIAMKTPNAFRGPFFKSMTNANFQVSLIGSNSSGIPPYDRWEGSPNDHTYDLRRDSLCSVPSQRPDLVLVEIGENDIIDFHNPVPAAYQIGRMIDDFGHIARSMPILVVALPPNLDAGINQQTTRFNSILSQVVLARKNAGDHVDYVDSSLTVSDLVSNPSGRFVELNPNGYVKMGNAFALAAVTAADKGWLDERISFDTSRCSHPPPPPRGLSSTCDLYASGGTSCVAAHSTVRSLFSTYDGSLYQVVRASDSAKIDIGVSPSSGYANSAAQDTFCSGTTCIITKIYDQTPNQNDLTIEGPGGNVKTPDVGAVANALPVTLNGNKVYGINVTSGVGYRNNFTHGVATGSSPEGMYMVTSGTNVNSGCCFDYGNAEVSGNDTGEGHMDAVNFTTACVFGPCNGPGPWAEADLENGQYTGNGPNPGVPSVSHNFVTAMLKNDGVNSFALKAGDAQSGKLATEYSGTLPTIRRGSAGYIPMHLEGAIVLGTGGDNSNSGIGSFFEGVMTSGYPTDATEDAVQANIVAAGYAGDSGGSGDTGGTVYTGPNDPGGAGPQDGFGPTATEEPNVIMGSKPALASFNGSLFAAFQANDASHTLFVAQTGGVDFPVAIDYPGIKMGSAPAMAEFNNQLYVAFQANDSTHTLFTTSSPTGTNFPPATDHTNISMGGAPALAVFNKQLYAAFRANDSSHTLFITSSLDGITWPKAYSINNVQIGSTPAMAVFNGTLYIAFKGDDQSNALWIASSSDGVHFTSKVLSGLQVAAVQTMGGKSSPALVVSNNVLYYIYGANDTSNELLVTASTDGVNFQGPAVYRGIEIGATGPAAAAFANGISVGFQSNDARDVLFVTSKATEGTVYTGPNDPDGPGPQDGFRATAIEQPNDLIGNKPAFSFFKNTLYAAFQANDASHTLFVARASGVDFPVAIDYPGIKMGSAPAMAEFNNQLYVAFQANDSTHTLFTTSSPTGTNFPPATDQTNITMGSAPALAGFNSQLYAAFRANDSSHTLFITSSPDGTTWPKAYSINNVQIGSAPAMAVFDGKLYVAFRGDDQSNALWIASSSDGVHFTSQVLTGQQMGGSSAPALAVYNNVLYCIYGANDENNEMLVTASADGTTWQGPAAYVNVQMDAAGPTAAAADGFAIYVGFKSKDSRNILYVTGKQASSVGK